MVVEPDREFLQLDNPFLREDIFDSLQVVGERLEDFFFEILVLFFE